MYDIVVRFCVTVRVKTRISLSFKDGLGSWVMFGQVDLAWALSWFSKSLEACNKKDFREYFGTPLRGKGVNNIRRNTVMAGDLTRPWPEARQV